MHGRKHRLPRLGRRARHLEAEQARAWTLERRLEELRAERADLRRILDGLGEGVLAVDRAGIVRHANRPAIELLDLDPAQLVGSHVFVAVPHPAASHALEDVMRGGGSEPLTRELVIDRGGVESILVVSVLPLREAGAEAEGAIAVVRDVTELRRLERARQDFFTNVSHELKTPITAIRGALETIVDDEEMPADVRAGFLASASSHATRLGTLVRDLLALARLEGDPARLERRPVDLAALARDVAAGVPGAPVEVAARAPDTELVVDGDAEALRQLVSNLVDNAVAHSDPDAAVRVELGRTGDVVELAVVDSGDGIPAEALDRVFERFYRVDEARSRARGGTGIGLSIVKHVAQAHGGSVRVDSTLGVGSTFHVRLPVSRPGIGGT